MFRHRFRAKLQYLTQLLGWLYIGAIALWFGLRLVFFDRFWWLALLNTIAFYLFVPVVLLLPLSIWLRLRGLLLGLALPIAIFVGLFGPLFLPSWAAPAPDSQNFKVMSFNLLWSNENYAQIAQSIRAAAPDIVGFQEVRPPNIEALTAALPDYPYTLFHQSDNYHTVGLMSRFPIVASEQLPDPPVERGLQTVIDLDGTPLTVIVAHLAPNNMPLFPLCEFVGQTQDRYTRRANEVEQLKQVVQTRDRPTVILCDCNMTDTSQTHAQLKSVLTDSFQQTGWGLGHTLRLGSIPWPLQRVDYVWHTADLQSVSAEVGDRGGSDHYPVIATLRPQSS
ncbi:endonuclease/exonuclease/phosphatase family protein [Leptolyngbya sp. CCNP1308]|uniref:endonuclease/exonuclease/phosphatase family protein n=1 Tax=Leptolyngbya sp. CCNP1308 TaxID=3110255 RepID=UPI002B2049BD|nr:endonuclease/exonuclease/phosphatase family protein [Leptolyngbya sp. CCNP1308]MEA5451315.1 endonuclease/exonuclease/phosphatase family protein [Leptolyngbya sp. CCNP1308]